MENGEIFFKTNFSKIRYVLIFYNKLFWSLLCNITTQDTGPKMPFSKVTEQLD